MLWDLVNTLTNFLYNPFLNKLIDALPEGSISLFNLLLVDTLFDLMEEGRKTETLLEMIIFVQRTDFTYDSVNFDDPISNLSYYKKLFQCFKEESVEETDQTFQELMEGYKMKTKEGSTNSAEVQALHIMRSAAEKIHDALRDVNRDSFLITAQFVFLVMQEAGGSLLDLLTDDDDDGDSSENDLKLVHNKNDTFSKDYEVLG